MNIIDSMLQFLSKKSVVPVETGNFAGNREWIKYSDGTAICICLNLALERTPISTRLGKPLYMAEIGFPEGLFIDTPVVNGALYCEQGSITVNMDTTTTKDTTRLYAIVDVATETKVAFNANFVAVGRWK